MKNYELSVVGRRIVTIPDDVDIAEYVDAIVNRNGTDVVEGGYESYDELLDDMEYDAIEYNRI